MLSSVACAIKKEEPLVGDLRRTRAVSPPGMRDRMVRADLSAAGLGPSR